MAEVEEARDAVVRLADPARHDAVEMGEVGIDVEADAVQADPALHSYADGRDLVLPVGALVGAAHPHADPVLAAFTADVEGRKGADKPFLQVGHESAHVAAAPLEVE